MARKVFVSSGHSNVANGDKGAFANGYFEGDLTIEFRNILTKELQILGVSWSTDPDVNALKQTLDYIKGKFFPSDILIDIHFNAGGGTGMEVIIPNVSTPFEKQLAQRIADVINNVTGLKKRNGGVKSESETARKTLGWMRPNSENILIEMCFIDNKTDMMVYQQNKYRLSKEIAKTLFDFSKI